VRQYENIEALPLEICGKAKEAVDVAEITALLKFNKGRDVDVTAERK
jgi:hypothetical protein